MRVVCARMGFHSRVPRGIFVAMILGGACFSTVINALALKMTVSSTYPNCHLERSGTSRTEISVESKTLHLLLGKDAAGNSPCIRFHGRARLQPCQSEPKKYKRVPHPCAFFLRKGGIPRSRPAWDFVASDFGWRSASALR